MFNRPIEIPYHKRQNIEKPIPHIYGGIDNDLARDNIEHDLPASDLADLEQSPPGSGGEDF